ncbi:MAG: hypothetical protein ACREVI_09500 [Steroidobacteraceae bacterium]
MRRFPFLFVLLLAGCAAPRPLPPAAVPPPGRAEARLPFEAWQVVASHLEVWVYRDGPMAKAGHNHLISTDALRGEVELREPRTETGLALELPLEALVVDDPAARAAAGPEFAAPVPEKDRAGTRQNMLGSAVLDAAKQGLLRVTADSIEGGPGDYQARLRIALRGEERVIAVPLTVTFDGDVLRVKADFRLSHADLGLKPFSIALGALRVRDDIEIRCSLEARRGA